MSRVRAHIVATCMRCAVGLSSESAAAAIRAGVSQVTEHPHLIDAEGEYVMCAREPTIALDAHAPDRMAQLVAAGLRDLAATLDAAQALPQQPIVLLALPEPRPGFGEDEIARITRSLASAAIEGTTSIRVHHVSEGHAGALLAIRDALALVTTGRAELIVAGGVDSYIDAGILAWLDADLRLARSGVRSGFPPGEGVGLVAIAGTETCRRLGLDPLAHIRGVACARETCDPKSDTGLLGKALGEAVEEATRSLALPGEVVTDTYGDINGELARNHDWGFALMRNAEKFRDGTDYMAFAGQCGDVGAATGGFGCALATEAWRYGRAHGPRALVWAASWGGLRGALLLERGVM